MDSIAPLIPAFSAISFCIPCFIVTKINLCIILCQEYINHSYNLFSCSKINLCLNMTMVYKDSYEYFVAALRFVTDKSGRHISQKSIAIAAGVSVPLISIAMNPNTPKRPGFVAQQKIANAVGMSYIEFLTLGRSLVETGQPHELSTDHANRPIIVNVNSQTDKDRLNEISDSYRGIPLYESGRLAAGVNGLEFDPYEEPASIVVVYKPELKGCSMHNLVALKVGGDSMEPTITKGSIVVVDLSDKARIDGKVFVVNTPESGLDMASIKRVRKWEKGFVLLSDNPNYPPVLSPLDWYRLCVGRVVWMWRNVRDV
jgi:phage repressor protein C with HTH and peptisase S24 domain